MRKRVCVVGRDIYGWLFLYKLMKKVIYSLEIQCEWLRVVDDM